MTPAILTILAALIPFAIWLYRQGAARKSDPLEQHRKRYEQIDLDLAKEDGTQAGIHGAADLDQFERMQSANQSHQRRSNTDPRETGGDSDSSR